MKLHPTLCLFLGFILLSTPSCSSVWIESTETFDVQADGVETVHCRTHNGRIELTGEPDAADIRVTVRKRTSGYDRESAEAAMDALDIVREVEGGELRLSHRWSTPPDSDWGASVSFDVQFPRGLAADVRSHNGSITVANVQRSCRARTHNGSIKVDGDVADAYLRSHNGRIRARLRQSGAVDYDVHTHNGSVVLTIDDTVSAKFRASTYNGSLGCDLPLEGLAVGRRSVTGVMRGGEGRVRVRTHNGSVRLRRGGRVF